MSNLLARGYHNHEGMPHSYSRAETSRSYVETILRPLNLNRDSVVLDLACGGGHEAAAIKEEFGSKVVETDLNFQAFAANPDKGRNFVTADINRLPFPENSFDFVHFKDGFVHLQHKEQFFDEVKKVLKEKGRLLLVTDCAYSNQKEKTKNFFILSQGGESSHRLITDMEDYRRQTEQALAYWSDMGVKDIILSLPFFTLSEQEIEVMAEAGGFKKISGAVPDLWRPQKNEKNWGEFTRNAFLFEKV